MRPLPTDIESAINRVDRLGDLSLLPRSDTPIDRYDNELGALFPASQLTNMTEFDYGRSYRYRIVNSQRPEAASFDAETFASAVRADGVVDVTDIAISILAPYCLVRFITYEWKDGEVEEIWADYPQNPIQRVAMTKLTSWMQNHHFRLLEPSLASEIVDGVATELCAAGDATVADCLFFG